MRRCWYLIVAILMFAGCEPAEDVDVLPLPELERPTPEARLGLPEIEGEWAFAGWEIIAGDSAVLERTFPSFGQLFIQEQRLDSVAGVFQVAGGNMPVIGDVRRDGRIALVTIQGGVPSRYLAGRYAQDTLWMELTSILQPEEWPQDARAAFVREAAEAPYAWLRGQRVEEVEPVDSVAAVEDSLVVSDSAPGTGPAISAPASGAGPGAVPGIQPSPQQPGAGARPGAGQPSGPPAGGVAPQPARPAPSQPQPQPPTQTDEPEPESEPEPEPEPEVEVPEPEIDMPDLLGAPVGQ